MSIYQDLNNIQMDVSDYEEEPLAAFEQKKWEKRVLRKLHKCKNNTSKKWLGLVVALVLTVGVMIPLGKVSVANMPFMAGMIEHFIDEEQPLDYAAYKTAIGETAENAYGKLTLNEVLIDEGNLLISSTFEPAKGVSFDYQTALIPQVLINGKNLTSTRGGQSIEVNDSMYTIYGDIELADLPKAESLQLEISYDTFNFEEAIDHPWVFDVTISTSQLAKETTTFHVDKTVALTNGQKVKLEKVIVTPISTLVYYDLTEASEATYFKIVSASGKEWSFKEASNSNTTGDQSYSRYAPIDIKNETYSLIPYNEHNEKMGPSIPIK